MKNAISSLAFGICVGLSVFTLIDYSLGIPDVTFSYATNECVVVENHPTVLFGTSEYSCENMPNKYNHIWVQ